ncbi:MAG: ribosomal protein S18-alanine N-acetyltransferase [Clostridia bacterium]|nr:ribosomal protein S18-alanine N-acetyltransferase [Clostridia bacterium]
MTVKPADINDLPFLKEAEKIFPDPYSEKILASHLRGESNRTLTLWENDTPVGYLLGNVIPPEGEVYRVAVLPAYRSRGGGTMLLAAFLREVSLCYLEVRASNLAAKRLYEKMGFTLCGRRKNYYQNPAEDALIYQKNSSSTESD